MTIPYQKAVIEGRKIKGDIPILDVQYGNVWTNISSDLLKQIQLNFGDILHFIIYNKNKKVYEGNAPYAETFGEVGKGKSLAYVNSLMQLSFALNQGNFASVYHISSGSDWSIEVEIMKRK